MLELALLVVAALLRWYSASGSPVTSATSMTEFVCLGNDRRLDVKPNYRTVHSVSVRVANSSFGGQCIVNVTFETSSQRRQRELSPLLLVKVERLQLFLPGDHFYVSTSNASHRTDNYCQAAPCHPIYLWASQSVQLYLYATNSLRVLASYVATFVVTEATNVCGLAGRSGELLVQSSGRIEYAFAPHTKHILLPPNNVTCDLDFNYSLTIRASAPSGSVNVNVLACPSDKRCETLLLNGRSCSDSATIASAPPGSPVTLNYLLRRCNEKVGFTGFVVSGVYESPADKELSVTVVATSVAASAATALAIGVAVALMCRRRRRLKSAGQKAPVRDVLQVQSTALASGEEIAMLDNDLYGATLASTTPAHQ